MTQPRPSIASVVVSLLILLAAAGTLALFMVPTTSPWFWPVAAALGATIASALLIPLKPRP